jgi:neurotransmitter:Na+ symporter, NSS family
MPPSETPPHRDQWQSGAGFILATLGAAVGLGNIWRFSFVAGENGGAAFLLVYVTFIVAIGLPILIAELAIGRRTQSEPVRAFATLGPRPGWGSFGVASIACAVIILAYYAVIAGWALKYFVAYVSGLAGEIARGPDAYFRAFTGGEVEPVLWQGAIMAVTAAIVSLGVARGIETANKILMPIFALMLLGLAGYALSLDNAKAGVSFIFAPDWGAFGRPAVYLAAIGQAFFSLGLAMGVLLIYGSYIPRTRRLVVPALTVVAGDTLFAVVAGLMIFPAVFSFGLDPAAGPSLAFITMPQVFAVMPGGELYGTAFFGLLVIAAITSSVALLEVPVSSAMARLGWRRALTGPAIGLVIFVLGIPAALSFGLLGDFRVSGLAILDAMDSLASNVLLPINGILIALFTGWMWRASDARRASDLGMGAVSSVWLQSLRYFVPALILLVMIRTIMTA